MWTSLRTATAKTGKALWMTETSGYFHTWPGTTAKPGPLDLGQAIYAALAYGNVSAWTYWQGSEKEGFTEYSLMAGASKLGKNYYVSKQFFRFIRPGAQRVDCKSSDPEVMAVAFSNPSMSAFTVVAINTGSGSKTLTLTGAGMPATYQAFRTSAKEDAVDLGSVAANAITLPGSSITTLINGSYRESGSTGSTSRGDTGIGGRTGGPTSSSTGGASGGNTAAATDPSTGTGDSVDADLAPTKSTSSGCGCQLGGSGPAPSAFWLLTLVGSAVIARSARKRSQ
jgi:MYXO-CTERM domain-containing protein